MFKGGGEVGCRGGQHKGGGGMLKGVMRLAAGGGNTRGGGMLKGGGEVG